MGTRPVRTFDDLIEHCDKSLGKYNADTLIALFKHLMRNVSEKRSGSLKPHFANARNGGLVANRFSALKKEKIFAGSDDFSMIFEGGHFDLGDATSPFPAQLFDEILKESKSGNEIALKFLDIFVDRLTNIDFLMREMLSFDVNPFYFENNSMLRIFDEVTTVKEDFLPMPKLNRPLDFQILKNCSFQRPLSAHVTKLILQKVFACSVTLIQYRIHHIEIPRTARLCLSSAGKSNLGRDSILGRYSPNANSALEILVSDLSSQDVDNLAVNKAFFHNLKVLFRAIFDRPITLIVVLHRKSGKGSSLGKNAVLGRTSWIDANNQNYTPVRLKFNSWDNHSA